MLRLSLCPPPAFVYSLNLFQKLGIDLLIEPLKNCSISSPERLSIQKLFWLRIKLSKKTLCVDPQTWYF